MSACSDNLELDIGLQAFPVFSSILSSFSRSALPFSETSSLRSDSVSRISESRWKEGRVAKEGTGESVSVLISFSKSSPFLKGACFLLLMLLKWDSLSLRNYSWRKLTEFRRLDIFRKLYMFSCIVYGVPGAGRIGSCLFWSIGGAPRERRDQRWLYRFLLRRMTSRWYAVMTEWGMAYLHHFEQLNDKLVCIHAEACRTLNSLLIIIWGLST